MKKLLIVMLLLVATSVCAEIIHEDVEVPEGYEFTGATQTHMTIYLYFYNDYKKSILVYHNRDVSNDDSFFSDSHTEWVLYKEIKMK